MKIYSEKSDDFFCTFEVGAVQKSVHLVDLVKSFHTSIYLRKSASIQPRTSILASPRTRTSLPKLGGDSIHSFCRLLGLDVATVQRVILHNPCVFQQSFSAVVDDFSDPIEVDFVTGKKGGSAKAAIALHETGPFIFSFAGFDAVLDAEMQVYGLGEPMGPDESPISPIIDPPSGRRASPLRRMLFH